MPVTLYEQDGCPYCEKVAQRLEELGVDYESVVVPERHSEREEVKELTGQRGVPVLVDEDRGVTMPESDRILEFIERSYSGPEAGS